MSDSTLTCAACTQGGAKPEAAEGRALAVALVTLVTMVAEITFGLITGSMALLADGIHMGTHALALGVTVGAYMLARRWRKHPGFSFGTGKVGVLGAYTNALLLGATAIFMVSEAVSRLIEPHAIAFDMALWVAGIGLAINLVSVLILGGGHHDHDHGHDHSHDDHDHDHDHKDSNLAAALAHVVADALTSVLAISALVAAKLWGWNWLDPAVALLGAGLILWWAWGLLKNSGALLLDFGEWGTDAQAIRDRVEGLGSQVRDLHIWRYGENQRSLLLTLSPAPGVQTAEEVRATLGHLTDAFGHVTIEVCGGR